MRTVAHLLTLACWLLAANGAWAGELRKVTFYGGPAGGVYTRIATGISELLAKDIPEVRVTVVPAAGSVSNLAHVNADQHVMAIALASAIDRERHGDSKAPAPPLANVTAVARLFGEYAHLAVLQQSSVQAPADLAARRVAVGARGSGTLTAAESFFRGVGLWKRILPDYSSYDLAARDFLSGNVHAVWQMIAYPSPSLREISGKAPIRLIPLRAEARASGLYAGNAHFTPGVIPAGTYRGVDYDVPTFQDQAIWVASRDLDPEFVYRALSIVFSPAGLEHLRTVHPATRELVQAEGRRDLPLPLHPGARRYWTGRH